MKTGLLILLTLYTITFFLNCNGDKPGISKQIIPPPDMVLVPAGKFVMGSDEVDASGKSKEFGLSEPWYLNEHPKHNAYLDSFFIDRFEVTNGQFKAFIMATGQFSKEQFIDIIRRLQMEENQHPVRNVTWLNAKQYCQAVHKRLPSEAEWEKAARGSNGLEYPWGSEWQPSYLNAGGQELDVMPVGSYEMGKSPYGAYDMSGNVMEWVEDWYQAYPGSTYKSPYFGKQRRVVRGGGWGGVGHYVIPHFFRTAHRYSFPPEKSYDDIGFRCAKAMVPVDKK